MSTADKARGLSQNRLVFQNLRSQIVRGTLLPGAKLNIALLAEAIGVSAGAVREGLAMLEAEALVVSEPLKGYRVSPISARDLTDLVNARIDIEKLCIAESIRQGDLVWEGGVVAAFHRLSRVGERDAADDQFLSGGWTDVHADFHRALVAGCRNTWLLRMHEMLYMQSERYRQLSVPVAHTPRDVGAEHQALVNAVLNRDVAAAQALVASHMQRTATILLTAPGLPVDQAG
ncbi:MAG: FCD domain-containing protein [Pseudomonadota bacterium]